MMGMSLRRMALASLAVAVACGRAPPQAPPPAPPTPPRPISSSAPAPSAPGEVDPRIEALLARMTLPDKIGQLVQLAGADDKGEKDQLERVASNAVGSMLNVTGARETNAYQRVALGKYPPAHPDLVRV